MRINNKPSTPVRTDNLQIDTLIGEHSSFNGELSFEGAVRIDGRFEGNLSSRKDGTLIISEAAEVVGEVDVPNLVLHGTIQGNVRATKSLKLGPSGKLNGDVEYALITLSEGAAINGRCSRIADKEPAMQPGTDTTAEAQAQPSQA
ncbi:MAG TPA: polymer-forming cytoskeletal protein [Mariprofundaceae bacterium]|nr:polymer-forming cytoskeletal protein [Mariprofundaceae bacterium]